MIAVDWGGSSLRAYRLDAGGRIIEHRRSNDGALASHGRFSQVLGGLIEGWSEGLVVLSGMIGARGGWIEMPYIDCPAGIGALAAGMRRLDADAPLAGHALWCVPGMADRGREAVDVMRGEETQIAGLLDTLGPGTHHLCLPGTHSKWVTIRDGRVVRIHTALTGELYGLLRRHSLVGALMDGGDNDAFEPSAFDAGLARSAHAGGLLHHLFGVRAAGLAGLYGDGLASYLSGLLVGHELRGGLAVDRAHPGLVHVVGSERLIEVYTRALAALGFEVRHHPEELAARGLHALWTRRAGMVHAPSASAG